MSLDHWENYYRGGLLATCPTGVAGSYDLEVRAAWVDFFKPLADGARIVDVGTGNGAVALIAREVAAASGRQWQIHGTDLARIDPVANVPNGASLFAGVQFHAETAAEQLPFDDASVDALGCHYVLEYTRMDEALKEFARVCKPGGRIQFVIHHHQSQLVDSANWSIREAEIVKESGVYRRLGQLIDIEGQVKQVVDKRSAELRASIQMLKQALQHAAQAGQGSILRVTLDAVKKLLEMRKQASANQVGKEIDRVRAELRAAVRRVKDLVKAARNEAEINEIKAIAARAGFDHLNFSPLLHAGHHLVGWRMTGRRST
ncbi:MAG: class I SAM-dependent methyltransferase [Anaerolineae bacterium]|nr:class I SAM-dependent methyltransferase [Anaerolineae bacterium]